MGGGGEGAAKDAMADRETGLCSIVTLSALSSSEVFFALIVVVIASAAVELPAKILTLTVMLPAFIDV